MMQIGNFVYVLDLLSSHTCKSVISIPEMIIVSSKANEEGSNTVCCSLHGIKMFCAITIIIINIVP